MREEKPRVAHVAFDGGIVAVQPQAHIGVGTFEAIVGNHGVRKPHESILVGVFCVDAGFNSGETYALLVLGEECGNLQECGKDL